MMAVDRGSLVSYATSKVGLSYVWGGTSDSGYDCSGLIYSAYQNQGASIPRTAQAQYHAASKVNTNNLQQGDLVFFSDTGSANNVTHVGMYIGNNQYVHAANSKQGVIVSTLNTSGNYFVGAGSLGSLSGGSSDVNIWSGFIQGGDTTLPTGGIGNSVVSGSNGSSEIVSNVDLAGNSWKEKLLEIVGTILKFITLVGIFALGAILFMKAFDIKGGILK